MEDHSFEDFSKMIKDILREQNIEDAVPTAPVHGLAETLASKGLPELQGLAGGLGIDQAASLSQAELIEKVALAMQDPEELTAMLCLLSEKELAFFQETAAQEESVLEMIRPDQYFRLLDLGLLQLFYHQDQLYAVVPQEIQAAYEQLKAGDYRGAKPLSDHLHKYALAAVSLYGLITLEELATLYNSQNQTLLTAEELSAVLSKYALRGYGYAFWEDYIVHLDLLEEDGQDAQHILKERAGKTRYTPPRDEFLRYTDPEYYEETPQIEALRKRLDDLLEDSEEAEELVDQIHEMGAAEAPMEEYLDLLEAYDLDLPKMKDMNKFMGLVIGVINNTRLWANYGHTPNELFSTMRSGVPSAPTGGMSSGPKIGRNDPCPCGSGKKYKKCCGQ